MLRPRLIPVLLASGWYPGRKRKDVEMAYAHKYGKASSDSAARFVREFGDLTIENKLWICLSQSDAHLTKKDKVEGVLKATACPVAFSGYMGEGCSIWVDTRGRFYAVDDEGILFLAEGINAVLGVLLLGHSPQPPPDDLKAKLLEAWHW